MAGASIFPRVYGRRFLGPSPPAPPPRVGEGSVPLNAFPLSCGAGEGAGGEGRFGRKAMTEVSSIQVLIPTPLRRYTNGEAKVDGSGRTVGDVLTELDGRYPGLKERVCDP